MRIEKDKYRLLNEVFALEVSRGHLKWTVTELARRGGMSRPLIYDHFGRTKEEILAYALEVVSDGFYGLSAEDRPDPAYRRRFLEGLVAARAAIRELPALTLFYQKCRAGRSPLADPFIRIERKFHARLSRIFPELGPDEIAGLHALFHGIASAPFCDEAAARAAISLVARGLGERSVATGTP